MASHSTTDNDSSTATNLDQQGSSRIPNFFRMPIEQRISALHQRGLISNEDVQLLSSGNHQVQLNVADKDDRKRGGRLWTAHGCGPEFFDQQP